MAEPLYCYPLQILCQPLSWWSSAAAWAQAILSVLAIWYSGRFALHQARSARLAKLDTYLAILGLAADEAASAVRHIDHLKPGYRIAVSSLDGDKGIFAKIATDLEAVSFHDLPHHRLVRIVKDAVVACRTLSLNYEKYFETGEEVTEYSKEQIRESSEALGFIYEDAQALRSKM